MRTTQRISVRDLVEFLLRSGDLDRRQSSGRRDAQAMQAGSRIHRKLQKQMGSDYQAEVTLKYQILLEDIPVSVEGRADGIWTDKRSEEPLIVIDEIKGTYRDLSRMEVLWRFIWHRQSVIPIFTDSSMGRCVWESG